jgi:hypothetical protein
MGKVQFEDIYILMLIRKICLLNQISNCLFIILVPMNFFIGLLSVPQSFFKIRQSSLKEEYKI